MKINWKVRIKNPQWWVQIALAVIMPVLGYFGMTGADITTWSILWETLLRALANPYVIGMAIVCAYNAVTDPTTAGIGDSKQALTYNAPKQKGE
jgi:phi LC3 family holin